MKDSNGIIAWLLAAEDHPHLREEPQYLLAEKELQASPDLQKMYKEHREFFDKHPVLTRLDGMPDDCRERIRDVLDSQNRQHAASQPQVLAPWGVRKQFAWAAVLVLLLAGMSFFSSRYVQKNHQTRQLAGLNSLPPEEAFYEYAGQLAGGGRLPLQYRENGGARLISWLENQGAQPFSAPENLMAMDTMGCAYLDGPHGKISLICFDTQDGTVHLFVAASGSLQLEGTRAPQLELVNGRQAVKWHDPENAYLLITHEEEQELPQMFL